MNRKIKIIFIGQLEDFEKHFPNVELDGHPLFQVTFIEEGFTGCGFKADFCIAAKEVVESEWFEKIIRPMLCTTGIGVLEDGE